MPKFRKKPIFIEAIQYTGHNGNELYIWSKGKVYESPVLEPTKNNPTGEYVQIKVSGGRFTANVGDWIVKNENNDFYPCNSEMFEKTYESVDSIFKPANYESTTIDITFDGQVLSKP